MTLQTFTAKTFKHAMDKVRQELGTEAVIVSNYEHDGQFYITAAIEKSYLPDAVNAALRILSAHHVSEDIQQYIQQQVPHGHHLHQKPLDILIDVFQKRLNLHPLNLSNLKNFMGTHQPCLALIGPPGVGKTASIAKLAIEAILQDLNPMIITLDSEKAGAIEQISLFANAIEIPFKTALTQEELASHMFQHDGLVLLDTTGLNPYDIKQLKFIKEIFSYTMAITVLVMQAGLDMDEYRDSINMFKELSPNYLIITKLDICRRLGNLLRLSLESGLPLSHFSHSPHISSPLVPFSALELAQFMQAKYDELMPSSQHNSLLQIESDTWM